MEHYPDKLHTRRVLSSFEAVESMIRIFTETGRNRKLDRGTQQF